MTWDATTTTYRRPDESPLATSGSSRLLTTGRRGSSHGSRRPRKAVTPEEAERRQFEERLRYALRDGAFLVLTVRPRRDDRLRAGELLRRFPELVRVSFDHLLLKHLRAKAAELEVDWQVVREADGAPPGTRGPREPARPGRAGDPGRRGRTPCVEEGRSCWFTRACLRAMIRWTCWNGSATRSVARGPARGCGCWWRPTSRASCP